MNIKNIEIFNNTMKKIKEDESLKKSVEYSKKNTKLYKEKEDLIIYKEANRAGNIKVINERSLKAAIGLENVAVLNFASATNPGGGVVNGSNAQEECLCRISSLYPCLNQENLKENYYNYHKKRKDTIYTDRCIYTSNVTVIKTDSQNPILLENDKRYDVNIITCPAPNIRNLKINQNELLDIYKRRIEKIIKIAIINGNTNLVLGAWGCGVFKNPPFLVARAFKEVLETYRKYFDNIIFAVLITPGTNGDENFKTFERIFKEKK